MRRFPITPSSAGPGYAFSANNDDFVIKPNRGSAGRGVLVIVGRRGAAFVRHNGETVNLDQLRQHLSDILSGMYSLGGRPDTALLQQRVRLHPVSRRLPIKASRTSASLSTATNRRWRCCGCLPRRPTAGRTCTRAVSESAWISRKVAAPRGAAQPRRSCHPDTARRSLACAYPTGHRCWRCHGGWRTAVGLGYLGVDIVVDAVEGPMLLEANARPGLAIQIANGEGLVSRLEEIDRRVEDSRTLMFPLSPDTPQRISA